MTILDLEQVLTLRSSRLRAVATLRSIIVRTLWEGFSVPTKSYRLLSEHICKSPYVYQALGIVSSYRNEFWSGEAKAGMNTYYLQLLVNSWRLA